MKIIISHRGNLAGPNPGEENDPGYVEFALALGFDVEIDVRTKDGNLYLGHDGPQYEIQYEFLYNPRIWVHCKDISTASNLINDRNINSFWHQKDSIGFTTKGYLWTYPGCKITPQSIAVLPERVEEWDMHLGHGICTDYPIKYRKIYGAF